MWQCGALSYSPHLQGAQPRPPLRKPSFGIIACIKLLYFNLGRKKSALKFYELADVNVRSVLTLLTRYCWPKMSPSSKAFFLPKVFPSSLFSLGEFVSNPMEPTVYPFIPSTPTGQVVEADPEKPYKTIVSLDKTGSISLKLTRLIDFGLGGQSANLLSIEAEEMNYRTLKFPDQDFRNIVAASEEARKWMSEVALNAKTCYMVVGLQELKNARFKRAKLAKAEGRAWVSVPLEATAQLPIEAGFKASATGMAIAEVVVNGVFGIEVRAIDLKTGKGGDPKLSDKISWKFSYERTKGPGHEEDSFLYAGLGPEPEVEAMEALQERDDDSDDDE
jgi:hypothetical protein